MKIKIRNKYFTTPIWHAVEYLLRTGKNTVTKTIPWGIDITIGQGDEHILPDGEEYLYIASIKLSPARLYDWITKTFGGDTIIPTICHIEQMGLVLNGNKVGWSIAFDHDNPDMPLKGLLESFKYGNDNNSLAIALQQSIIRSLTDADGTILTYVELARILINPTTQEVIRYV